MESALLISYGAFFVEVIVFVVGMYMTLRVPAQSANGGHSPRRVIWLWVIFACAGVALMFPVSYVIRHPETLASIHPFNLALLILAPTMPLIMAYVVVSKRWR